MAKKIFVGNLPHSINNDQLKEIFAPFGNVISAKVISDRETGRSRGFGFVEMESDEEADAAIHGLNESEVEGRALSVNEARPREEGGGGNRGGRGGGGFGGNRGGPRREREHGGGRRDRY